MSLTCIPKNAQDFETGYILSYWPKPSASVKTCIFLLWPLVNWGCNRLHFGPTSPWALIFPIPNFDCEKKMYSFMTSIPTNSHLEYSFQVKSGHTHILTFLRLHFPWFVACVGMSPTLCGNDSPEYQIRYFLWRRKWQLFIHLFIHSFIRYFSPHRQWKNVAVGLCPNTSNPPCVGQEADFAKIGTVAQGGGYLTRI